VKVRLVLAGNFQWKKRGIRLNSVYFSAGYPANFGNLTKNRVTLARPPKFEGFMRDYFIEMPKDMWQDGGMGKVMAGIWYTMNAAIIGLVGLGGAAIGYNVHQHNQAATFEKTCTEISSPVSRTDCILPGLKSENAYIRQFSIQMIPTMTVSEQAKVELYVKALRDPSHSVYQVVREEIAKYLASPASEGNTQIRDALRQLNAEAPELYTTTTTTFVMVNKVMVPQTHTTTHRRPYTEHYRQLESNLLTKVSQ
jgi:hypothetical protein